MRQQVYIRQHFRRGNAILILIVAPQGHSVRLFCHSNRRAFEARSQVLAAAKVFSTPLTGSRVDNETKLGDRRRRRSDHQSGSRALVLRSRQESHGRDQRREPLGPRVPTPGEVAAVISDAARSFKEQRLREARRRALGSTDARPRQQASDLMCATWECPTASRSRMFAWDVFGRGKMLLFCCDEEPLSNKGMKLAECDSRRWPERRGRNAATGTGLVWRRSPHSLA